MTACPCRGLAGLALALCLAPPKGEYETEVTISNNISIIINREGAFLRRVVTDDMLPFVHTIDRPVGEETLRAYNINLEKILCLNIDNLKRAASAGSRVAASILNACRDLVRVLEEKCEEAT